MSSLPIRALTGATEPRRALTGATEPGPVDPQGFNRFAPIQRQALAVTLIGLRGDDDQTRITEAELAIYSAHLGAIQKVTGGAAWSWRAQLAPAALSSLQGAEVGTHFAGFGPAESATAIDTFKSHLWANGQAGAFVRNLEGRIREAIPADGFAPYEVSEGRTASPRELAQAFVRHADPKIQAIAALVIESRALLFVSDRSPAEEALSDALRPGFVALTSMRPDHAQTWQRGADAICARAAEGGIDLGNYLLSGAYLRDDGAHLIESFAGPRKLSVDQRKFLADLEASFRAVSP